MHMRQNVHIYRPFLYIQHVWIILHLVLLPKAVMQRIENHVD